MSSSLWTTEANGYLTFCVSVAFLYSVIFCFFNCDFHAKIAIYSRKNIPSRDMRDNLAPQRNFYPLCRRLFRNFL